MWRGVPGGYNRGGGPAPSALSRAGSCLYRNLVKKPCVFLRDLYMNPSILGLQGQGQGLLNCPFIVIALRFSGRPTCSDNGFGVALNNLPRTLFQLVELTQQGPRKTHTLCLKLFGPEAQI